MKDRLRQAEVFHFKQFDLHHGQSSMPVGTDATLLGAWADIPGDVPGEGSVADIGCGCGILALMAAQRFPHARVTGIDIDESSVREACRNAQECPFADRVVFLCEDIREYARVQGQQSFMLVLSNPPYFTEDTLPPDARRSLARNSVHLCFAELLAAVKRMLHRDGAFAVVLPMQARDGFVGEALLCGLHLRRECRVRTVMRKPPKRVLLQFMVQGGELTLEPDLVLMDDSGRRSARYAALCAGFYIDGGTR